MEAVIATDMIKFLIAKRLITIRFPWVRIAEEQQTWADVSEVRVNKLAQQATGGGVHEVHWVQGLPAKVFADVAANNHNPFGWVLGIPFSPKGRQIPDPVVPIKEGFSSD